MHHQQFTPGNQGMRTARAHSMHVTNNLKPLGACNIAGSMADSPGECTARGSTAPLASHSSPQHSAQVAVAKPTRSEPRVASNTV